MTREQAITTYVTNLIGDDLANLIQHMNVHDGCFPESVYYDMGDFDEFMDGYTPMEIAQMIWFGEFNPNDAYFCFNGYGNLESFNWGDVVAEAEAVKDGIIYHLVHHYTGDTPWPDLDELVDADADAIFNGDYEEVDGEEEEQ